MNLYNKYAHAISLILIFADGQMNAFYLYIIIQKVFSSNNIIKNGIVYLDIKLYSVFSAFFRLFQWFFPFIANARKKPDILINMRGKEGK